MCIKPPVHNFPLWKQGGPGTEPETGIVGTVFPGTERGTGRRNRFPGTTAPSLEEPREPKTGTARTVPSPNRNRTEPNRGHPV